MDRKDELLRRFGQRIAALRTERQFTIPALAEAAGLAQKQVKQIEAGEVNLLLTTILALSKGLGVTPEQLLQAIDFEQEE